MPIIEKRFIYELHQRREKRGIVLENLSPSDVWRVNLVTADKSDCYRTLGLVHELFPPDQKEICDYIAEPRPNGHRFLSTYVEVPRFGRLLIHIRDREM